MYNDSGIGNASVSRFLWVIKSTVRPSHSLQLIVKLLVLLMGGETQFKQRVIVVFSFCDEQAKTKAQAKAFLKQATTLEIDESNIYFYGLNTKGFRVAGRTNMLD